MRAASWQFFAVLTPVRPTLPSDPRAPLTLFQHSRTYTYIGSRARHLSIGVAIAKYSTQSYDAQQREIVYRLDNVYIYCTSNLVGMPWLGLVGQGAGSRPQACAREDYA